MTMQATKTDDGLLGVFGGIARGWDNFWFNKVDPTTLGWVRFWCGLLTFYVTLTYSWGLFGYLGKDAFINETVALDFMRNGENYSPALDWSDRNILAARGSYNWSIFLHVTSPEWIIALHVFFLLNMLLFTVGFMTRVTGLITWVGAMSYVQRAWFTVFGLDTMMMILLAYLQIGPAGATLSVDRLLQKWWAKRNGLPEPVVEESYSAHFALRLMQVHFAVVYFASGTTKLLGSTWWSGTSLNWVFLNAMFTPMYLWIYREPLRMMAQHRWLWEAFMSFSIVFTIMLELSFPFLVWNKKWRWALLCGAVMLHTGIALVMGLTTFSLMMLVFVSSFLPPDVVTRIVDATWARIERWRPTPHTKSTGQPGQLVMSR